MERQQQDNQVEEEEACGVNIFEPAHELNEPATNEPSRAQLLACYNKVEPSQLAIITSRLEPSRAEQARCPALTRRRHEDFCNRVSCSKGTIPTELRYYLI